MVPGSPSPTTGTARLIPGGAEEIAQGENKTAIGLAEAIVTAQQKEVAEMQGLLEGLNVIPRGGLVTPTAPPGLRGVP